MVLNIIIISSFLICLFSSFKKSLKDNNVPFSKESTYSLRGFSSLMIIFAHIAQYEKSFKNVILFGGMSYRLIFSLGAVGVSLFFILSGYGCYISIQNSCNKKSWLIKQIFKIICHYFAALLVSIIISFLLFGGTYSLNDLFVDIIHLRIPNTSSWYLRIQLLCYISLAIASMINIKHSLLLTTLLIYIYALTSCYFFKMPDYWWKTVLCFPTGCALAHVNDLNISNILKKQNIFLFVIIMVISYFAVIFDKSFSFLIQTIGYIFLSLSIVVIWDRFINDTIYKRINKYTLDVYLIHISLVETVFVQENITLNIKVLCFVIITIIGTLLSHYGATILLNLIDKSNNRVIKDGSIS